MIEFRGLLLQYKSKSWYTAEVIQDNKNGNSESGRSIVNGFGLPEGVPDK